MVVPTEEVAGLPRVLVLSKVLPSNKVPVYSTVTLSSLPAFPPVPALTILYCRPLGKVTTPSLVLFLARNSSPSFWFFLPASSDSFLRFSMRSEEHTSELQSQFHL